MPILENSELKAKIVSKYEQMQSEEILKAYKRSERPNVEEKVIWSSSQGESLQDAA